MNDLNFFNQKKKKKKPKKVFDNDVEEGLKVSRCETSKSLVFLVTFGLCVVVFSVCLIILHQEVLFFFFHCFHNFS